MTTLRTCLPEVLDIIMDHLVIAVGIQKAVLLRTVHKAFDSAILNAICTRQVVDIDDPATPRLAHRMNPKLRGKILAQKSRAISNFSKGYVHAIANVNDALDMLLDGLDEEARARHESIAEFVILKEANDRITDKIKFQNILCGAAIIGNTSIARSMLLFDESKPTQATVNGVTPYFPTALTLAAATSNLEMVQFLLDNGARLETEARFWKMHQDLAELGDWNSHDENRHWSVLFELHPGALRAAVSGGNTNLVRLLLSPEHRLPTTSLEYLRAILAGARAGRLDLVDLLFVSIGKSLSDFKNLDKFMMWEAIRGDQSEVVQMLIKEGVDINALPYGDGYPLRGTLHLAASLGKTRPMKILLDEGANINAGPRSYGGLPLEGAAIRGQKDTVDILLDRGGDPARAFCAAANGSQAWLMKHLLSRFPEELTDVLVFQRCFREAVESRNLRAMDILVEAGAPINECYNDEGADNMLPIDRAMAYYGHSWVVEHLLALGSRITGNVQPRGWDHNVIVRKVLVTKRTWDWVGRY